MSPDRWRLLPQPRPWPSVVPPARAARSGEKTVLFLGAGASASDAVPIQRLLLPIARALHEAGLRQHGVQEDWPRVRAFLDKLAPGLGEEAARLEDCLTFLDKATLTGEVVAGAGPIAAHEPRRALLNCIAAVLDLAQSGGLPREAAARVEREQGAPTRPMARLGALLSRSARRERDRFVVVTTNWDTTIDFALRPVDGLSVADYRAHTTPWEQHFERAGQDAEEDVPSMWKRALGLPALKLIKLHGSMNWLWCPTCSRLYTSARTNIALLGTAPEPDPARQACPACYRLSGDTERAPLLREVLVSPTMIKRLDMAHVRMVWYSALVELSEASEVVFVGYSAPPADFELRYLLAKAFAVRREPPRVRIVTREGPDVDGLAANYRSLLGGRTPEPEPMGVDAFVRELESREA